MNANLNLEQLESLVSAKSDLDISMEPGNRENVVRILRGILADEYLLYTKTRNYHWNVEGMSFGALHDMFQQQYEKLDGFIDDTAERIRALGYYSPGSMAEFIHHSRLLEEPSGSYPEAKEMVRRLAQDHQTLIRELRKGVHETDQNFGDVGTSDFLTGLMEEHEKMAWMLWAHVNR
jgi:starvation-inducible DNA-binding protein